MKSLHAFSLFIGLYPDGNYVNILFSQVLDEIFWRHSWDVSKLNPNKCISLICLCVSLTFTPISWAYISTFKFLCSGINFNPCCLGIFWFSEGQLLRPLELFHQLLWRAILPSNNFEFEKYFLKFTSSKVKNHEYF